MLLQAVWAGASIDRTDRAAWVTVDEIGAFAVVVLALGTAVVAAATLRRASSALALGALAQVVLIVVQTGLGEAITEGGADGLIVAHVPIAMLIFGLGIYLSIVGARLRRSGEAVAEPGQSEGVAIVDPAVAGVEELEGHSLLRQSDRAQLIAECLRAQVEIPLVTSTGIKPHRA